MVAPTGFEPVSWSRHVFANVCVTEQDSTTRSIRVPIELTRAEHLCVTRVRRPWTKVRWQKPFVTLSMTTGSNRPKSGIDGRRGLCGESC